MSRLSRTLARLLCCVLFMALAGLCLAATDAPARPGPAPAAVDVAPRVVEVPAWLDRDGDRVADALETVYRKERKAGPQVPGEPPVADLLIGLDHAPGEADRARLQALGAAVPEMWGELVYVVRARFPSAQLSAAALERLGQEPGVVWVEENPVIRLAGYFATRQTRARAVWAAGLEGNPNHSIAILDSGLDASHPDIASRVIGWADFAGVRYEVPGDEYPAPIDKQAHGTFVAGLAAGDGSAAGIASGVGPLNLSFVTPLSTTMTSRIFPVDTRAAEGPSAVTARLRWQGELPNVFHAVELFREAAGGGGLLGNAWTPATGPQPFEVTVNNVPPGLFTHSVEALVGTTTNFQGLALPGWLQVSTPMSAAGDGRPLMRGVAPACKIVGVKIADDTLSGFTSGSAVINGIAWLNANRRALNVVCVNASFTAAPGAVIDSMVNQIVRNGVVWVNAAGNSRSSGPGVGSPGSAAKAITVGATAADDRVSSFSSYGREGQRKPDLVAPGGSGRTGQLAAADSNSADMDNLTSPTPHADQFPNDYRLSAGTSFAAPQVAGAAMLVAQAMGTWTYTEAQALRVKSLLLMTASETGQAAEQLPHPALDRGAKDVSEGFGRLNVDAAVEAVRETLVPGTPQTAALGPSVVDRRAWARNVALTAGAAYSFVLANPPNADYDLYLYSDTPVSVGGSDGEPHLVASSARARFGGAEVIAAFTPAATGRYYVVVKYVGGDGGAFQVNASAVADFALSVTPGAQMLEAKGESVRYAVSVTGLGGFQEAVSLAVAGTLPEGVTAQFDPPSVNPGGTSTLTLATSAATPSGSLAVTIQGSAGGITRNAAVRLDVGAIWPRFHHDGRGSGRSAFNGPRTARPAWVYRTGPIFSSPAIGGDGTLYVGARNGIFHAIRTSDGTARWLFAVTGNVNVDSSPAIGMDGTIYFGADDGRFYALRPDGTQKWVFQLGSAAVNTGPVIAPDGTVYVTAGGILHAMRPDGTRKWTYDTGAGENSSPALGPDGTIYFGGGNRLLAIRDTGDSGERKWEHETAGSVLSSPAIANGRIYFGATGDDSGGRFYVLSDAGSSATRVREATTGGAVHSSPAVGADGSLYVGSDDNDLYAFDAGGVLKWRFTTTGGVRGAPAVGGDGIIYFGSLNHRVYAVRDGGTSASEVWSAPIGGEVASSPAIGADGALYAASMDGTLAAFLDTAPPSFAVGISDPAPGTALVGGTVSYTVTLQALAGFSGPVSLEVTGRLPAGVTAQFDPATFNLAEGGTGRVTLRLISTTGSPPGQFLFRVRATAGSVTRESNRTRLTLTDNSFSLDGQPAVQRVPAGQSTMFSVVALPNPVGASFNGTIALAAAVISGPSGGTPPALALDLASIPVGGLATLTVTTAPGTLPGSYNIEVRGTSGAFTRSTQFRLEVQ